MIEFFSSLATVFLVFGSYFAPTILSAVVPSPNIARITPSTIYRDPPRWVEDIVIEGSGFSLLTRIYFDDRILPSSFVSGTRMTVSLPKSFLDPMESVGAHRVVAANSDARSAPTQFIVQSSPVAPSSVVSGGGDTGLAKTTYVHRKKPIVQRISVESVGATTRLRVVGSNFDQPRIRLNGQFLPTTVVDDGLVGEISPEILATLTPGVSARVRVQNGGATVTVAGKNFTFDSQIIARGSNGVEQPLPSRAGNGSVEADIDALLPGKYFLFVASGTGKNRISSPWQEINIPQP